jgi:hypothetical protein
MGKRQKQTRRSLPSPVIKCLKKIKNVTMGRPKKLKAETKPAKPKLDRKAKRKRDSDNA